MAFSDSLERALRLVILFVLVGSASCTSLPRWKLDPWDTQYEYAERCAADSRRTMLIVYFDGRRDRDRAFRDVLKQPAIKAATSNFVRCTLFRPHEPDRRYADQFHMRRAPALIVVHPDETYHTFSGPMTEAEITSFLAGANGPGATLVRNPYVPRDSDYRWYKTWSGAQEAARGANRSILVVIHRVPSADWRRLTELLDRPEVYRRFQDMVHCEDIVFSPLAEFTPSSWGQVQLPALAIVHPDGSYATLEMPTSFESIIHFAERFGHPGVPGLQASNRAVVP